MIFQRATAEILGAHCPAIGPHISLMYGEPSLAIDRAALGVELAGKIPKQIEFEAVELVMPTSGQWRDIDSWKIDRAFSLRS